MIKICVPYNETICKETQLSIDACVNAGIAEVEYAKGTYINTAREYLISKDADCHIRPTIDKRYSHFLLVDSDMQFSIDDVLRLKDHRKSIVSAAYKTHDDKTWVCGYFDGFRIKFISVGEEPKGLVALCWAGNGLMLIEREYFEKVSAPWFGYDTRYKDEKFSFIGEDIIFCEKAKKHGYKIYVDFDTEVNHLNRGQQMEQQQRNLDSEELAITKHISRIYGDIRGLAGQITALKDENDSLKKELSSLKSTKKVSK